MGKFTVEKWKCDRCGMVADTWLRPAYFLDVSICQDYDVGPGPRVHWKEMCVDCTREVSEEFGAMQKSAKEAQRRVREGDTHGD